MDTELKQGFLTPLRVENIDARNWSILERFGWRGSKGDTFWVEPGDTTDFASVPWWTQAILPRTGTWTKAAVLHDKMCELQNEYYLLKKKYELFISVDPVAAAELDLVKVPVFNSVDTDAIFRKNAREGGTDPIRSELLWFGVRCGALKNPARRDGWMSTSRRWFADLIGIVGVLYAFTFLVVWVTHMSMGWNH